MLKKSLALALAAVVACFAVTLQADDQEEKEFKPTCPVSGRPAVKDATADYKGGKVYFCCPNCPGAFAKDPAKFAAKANHQLVGTKQAVEKKCPLTGRNLNPETAIEIQGVKVAFCCNNCKGKVANAEAPQQLILVFSDAAFAKGFEVKKEKEAEANQ